MRLSVVLAATVLAAAAIDFQKEEFREEDLPQIFRELSERHARIERFSKDLAKQTNIANRESSILQSAMLPRPPISHPLDPIDNRLPDLPERSTVVETTKSIETTGNADYETESVIASPPPPLSSDAEEKKFLLSEKFFQTSTNQPRARAAPTLPSIYVLPLSTPATEEPSTTEGTTTTTTTFPTTHTPTTPREVEEERAATVTLPSVRRTTPRAVRGLRPLSFPPLPKFLPTRRNALPERMCMDCN